MITPKQKIGVYLPASDIPSESRVYKRGGTTVYTLKHELVVHMDAKVPLKVKGAFLIKGTSINQIKDTDMLIWDVAADDFVAHARTAFGWTPTRDDGPFAR